MASRVNVNNISLGLGVLEIGDITNGVFSAYRDLGAIKAEGQVRMQRNQAHFMTGRPLVLIKNETTEEMVTLQFTLAEVTVANIKDCIGGGLITSSNASATFLDGTTVAPQGNLSTSVVAVGLNNQFTLGGQTDVFSVGIRFTHVKSTTTGKRQIFEGYIAQPAGELALPFRETDWNLYQIDFQLVADTTRAAGAQYFQFIDEL